MENTTNRTGLTPERLTDLVDRARKSDQQAITDLYNESYYEVFYTVQSMVKDTATAHDVMQDAYVKAFNSLDTLQDPASFVTWLRRIAHNRAADYLRQKRPVLMSDMADDDGNEPDFPDPNPTVDPAEALDREETARIVRSILDTLSPGERAAVSLFYYEQLPVREIARMLGTTENSVKVQLNHGRNKIKQRVEDYEKQGLKLYGLAPLPFFLYLLRQVKAFGVAEAAGITTAASAAAGKAAPVASSGSASGTAGRASLAAGGKTAAKTGFGAFLAAHKVGAILAAAGAALVIGGAATVIALSGGSSDSELFRQSGSSVNSSDGSGITAEIQSDNAHSFQKEYPADAVLLYEERNNNGSDTPMDKTYCVYDEDNRLIQKATYSWAKDAPYWLSSYHNYFYSSADHPDQVGQEFWVTMNDDGTVEKTVSTYYTYDEAGHVTEKSEYTSWASGESTDDKTVYTWDGDRLLQEEYSYSGMDNPHLTVYSYDNGGDKPTSSRFMPGSYVGTPSQTTYEYDESGNCITQYVQIYTNSNGLEDHEKIVFTYNDAGYMTSETHYEADFGDFISPQPGQATHWDQDELHSYRWTYDSNGHVLSYTWNSDAFNKRTIRYDYGNPGDNPISRSVLAYYDRSHPLADEIRPASYAELVLDREARWGHGAITQRTEYNSCYQFVGVPVVQLIDLDADGTEELLLAYNTSGLFGFHMEFWGMQGGKPVLLCHKELYEELFDHDLLAIAEVEGKKYLVTGYEGEQWQSYEIQALGPNGLETVHTMSWNIFGDCTVDGQAVSETDYRQMENTWIPYEARINLVSYSDDLSELEALLRQTAQARRQLDLEPLPGSEAD